MLFHSRRRKYRALLLREGVVVSEEKEKSNATDESSRVEV
jgi:hypothetical protein